MRPILTYGSECWTLTKTNEERLRIFERKVLRRIFGPVNENGTWRIKYNNEIYSSFSDVDIVKHIKISRLRWAGHIIRMEEDNPVRKLTLLKPEGSRRVGRPKLRWMDGIEEDLRKIGTRAWRRRALDRDDWRKVLAAARAQTGL